jgi:hypothetical protein
MWSHLQHASNRTRVYVALGLFSLFLAITSEMTRPEFRFSVSDARGYYAYLPSVVIDRDLDLSNQFSLDDWREGPIEQRTPTGLVNGKYPVGVSVSLAPEFLVAHAMATVFYAVTGATAVEPTGYSVIYQLFAVMYVCTLAVATMWLIDRLATAALQIQGSAVGLAVVFYWVGSSYLYYTMRQPLLAHVIGAFWVTAAVVAAARALGEWKSGTRAPHWIAIFAASAGMAVITRPTNAVLIVFVLYLVYSGARANRHYDLLAISAGVVPLLIQMIVWKRMSGSYLYYSYQDEVFDWRHPALVQTLFSTRHGLFSWTPLLLLSVAGFLQRKALSAPLVRVALLALVSLWVLNSSWDIWWFGAAFGGRAFVDLALVFVVGLAWQFEKSEAMGPRALVRTVATASVCASFSLALMALYIFKVIPTEDVLLWF